MLVEKKEEKVMIEDAIALAKKNNWVASGDEIVVVSGALPGVSGSTNSLKVLQVP